VTNEQQQWFEQFLPDDQFKLWWTVRNQSWGDDKFQDVFVEYLTQVPSDQWTDCDKEVMNQLLRGFGDAFLKRLVSGIANVTRRGHRIPLLDDTQKFVFENWKMLRFPNPEGRLGLRAWRPCVVMELLEHMRKLRPKQFYCWVREKKYNERSYIKFRNKLGLKPHLLGGTYPIRELPREISQLPIELLLRPLWLSFFCAKVDRAEWDALKRKRGGKHGVLIITPPQTSE
jgi:hypothetical protein